MKPKWYMLIVAGVLDPAFQGPQSGAVLGRNESRGAPPAGPYERGSSGENTGLQGGAD